MPKSSKKKKDKAADFSKAKLKLGKGKQVANNATDTSFKARSIAVPHQTIGQEKDASKPITRRNLTLDELLSHLKHYNPGTRKDAIWGLREILDAHPRLMESSLTPVIQACARVVGDEDAEVRKALLSLLTWLFRLVPLERIRPHAPLLILFITSAQTHIFPAIRIDAVRFLDLLLEVTPETVIQGWGELESTGSRVLEGYLGLLNAGSSYWTGHKDDTPAPSASSVTLSSNSKHIVLSSLASFLQKAISPLTPEHNSGLPTWYMTSSFSTHTEYVAFCSLIRPRFSAGSDSTNEIEWSNTTQQSNTEDFVGPFDCAWVPTTGNGFSLGELGEVGQVIDAFKNNLASNLNSDSTSSRLARLSHTLHPILVSTWLDVAPGVLGGVGAPGEALEAQLAISVTQIAGCLYGAIFRDVDLSVDARSSAFNDIVALLGYMSTYLPCISENGEAQSEDFSRDLSFAYCELTSLAMLASQSDTGNSNSKNHGLAKAKKNKALSTQVDRVGEYVVKALDGELISVTHPLGYSLTVSAYTMLLPTMWSLLKYEASGENTTISIRIRTSCINHALRISSKSGTKAAATQFVGMLALMHSQRKELLRSHTNLTTGELERFREWYQQLPKVLWEVGAGDPLLTETILRLLLRLTQQRTALFDAATNASVRSRLTPYFSTAHPERGQILGPFAKIKPWPRLRRLALDAAVTLLQDVTADALRLAVDNAVKGTEDERYWCTLLV